MDSVGFLLSWSQLDLSKVDLKIQRGPQKEGLHGKENKEKEHLHLLNSYCVPDVMLGVLLPLSLLILKTFLWVPTAVPMDRQSK